MQTARTMSNPGFIGRTRKHAVASCLILMAAAAAAGDDLDEVGEALVKAQSGLRTYSAKFEGRSSVTRSMKFELHGTFEWARAGEVVRYRRDVKRTATHDFEGEPMVVEENRTMLSDGRFDYQINNDSRNVLKQKADSESIDGMSATALLRQLESTFNEARRLPDETIDGHDCYVVEGSGTYRDDDDDDEFIIVHREVIWFAKDTGMPIRLRGFDKSGKAVQLMDYSEIQRDPKLDPARFQFTASADMNVMDRSGE